MLKKRLVAISSWFIGFYVYWWLHEFAGHYLINLLCGIHTNQMKVVGIRINDILILPTHINYINVEIPRISLFMGGAVSALILISVSLIFLKIYNTRRQERFFVIFSVLLGIACIGLVETIVEPFFPVYHRMLTNSIVLIAISIIVPIFINNIHKRKANGELRW